MTEQDALDMFDELPERVQTAIISHIHSMRSRSRVEFSDYGGIQLAVAEYIAGSGLLDVEFRKSGVVRFAANENTAHLKANWARVLGVEKWKTTTE